MTHIIIGLMLVIFIPLALIITFNKIDEELNNKLKLTKLSIIIIIALGIIYSLLGYKAIQNEIQYINTMLITGYLVFMSYTDQRTKLLYTSISVIALLIEIVFIIQNYESTVQLFNDYTWTIFAIIVILGVMSMFRWIGSGDVLIYAVLSLYLIQYRTLPTMSLMINILITNILFVIVTSILKIIKHNKEKYQPLTIYITISTLICNMLLI